MNWKLWAGVACVAGLSWVSMPLATMAAGPASPHDPNAGMLAPLEDVHWRPYLHRHCYWHRHRHGFLHRHCRWHRGGHGGIIIIL
jgi:hypothetical protein